MTVGIQFIQEYEMRHSSGSYFFDFALPRLKLLVEIDSWSYHHTKRHKIRDACKHSFAEANGWTLIRLRGKSKIGLRAIRAIREYRSLKEKPQKLIMTDWLHKMCIAKIEKLMAQTESD